MLDLAVVLALAARCAPDVSPPTLAALAYAESRFDPLAIGVNGARPIRQPTSRQEAIRTARRLIESGANIDLGLAQINSSNLGWLSLSIPDAFDPCRNLTAAATVLRAGFRPVSDQPNDRQHALRVALSRYNTGHPDRGFRNGYVSRVEASGRRLGVLKTPDASAGADHAESPAWGSSAPVAAWPAWDVFAAGSARQALVFASERPHQTRSVVP